jgi:hypothetical protein
MSVTRSATPNEVRKGFAPRDGPRRIEQDSCKMGMSAQDRGEQAAIAAADIRDGMHIRPIQRLFATLGESGTRPIDKSPQMSMR